MTEQERSEDPLGGFVEVMRRLREECDWKRSQTHRSLTRYLLEETHELIEALDTFAGPLNEGDDVLLREELGDVLLQVVFHAVIAEERGAFTMEDVAAEVTAKMVRRNPHVFASAGGTAPSAAEVTEAWERIKATEKGRGSVLDGLAPTLPALLYADKVVDRAERAGTPVVVDPGSADLGARLLALVAEAHRNGIDPEQALRDTVRAHVSH